MHTDWYAPWYVESASNILDSIAQDQKEAPVFPALHLKVDENLEYLSNSGYIIMLSCFSRVQLFSTPWTVACQAPLSMGFSRQEYWSGLPFHSPGDLPNPGTEPTSLVFPALAGRLFYH